MNIGVVFAGGVGTRMNSKALPKQFLKIYDKPIIIHTIEHFERNNLIDAIVVVCISEWIEYFLELKKRYGLKKVCAVVPGGKTGQESIYFGLVAAKRVAGEEKSVVLIHDGVRPLITSDLITQNILAVKKNGSAITCAVVKETIVEKDKNNQIINVPSRENSRLARAPQSFWLDDILAAHIRAIDEGKTDFIDSCSLMKYYGNKLYVIDGPVENIKITTPDDFYTMRAILEAKENEQIYGL